MEVSTRSASRSDSSPVPASPRPDAIRFEHVSKAYRIFASKHDNLIDSVGLKWLMPWYRVKHHDFFALRDVTFTLPKGQRLGVVGRNGAGKTTLLKLITNNLRPTSGHVTVNGQIQALIDAGTGFHPDFTGRENVRASLTYQGFGGKRLDEATADIADFAELGDFMDRPFRTYSSGMMARLIFAAATAVRPEILVIDEILGAGDAYFVGKSNERMRQLVDSDASIVIVSHSMEQITLLCEQAIWLDRGRIVKSGPSLDVVTAYTQFMRRLEDRRQRARNQKVRSRRRHAYEALDSYGETAVLRFLTSDDLKVSKIRFLHGQDVEAECAIGDAQDSEPSQSAFVVLPDNAWSGPQIEDGSPYRAISGRGRELAAAIAMNLYTFYPREMYTLELTYDARRQPAAVELWRDGVVRERFDLPTTRGFQTLALPVADVDDSTQRPAPIVDITPGEPGNEESAQPDGVADDSRPARPPTRWPGEGSLLIESVSLRGSTGAEQAVFEHGERMVVALSARAVRAGSYPVTPAAVLYRIDGTKVFSMIGEPIEYGLVERGTIALELTIPALNLGNGHYAFALALYRTLDPVRESVWYDLIDRDYRFEVVGAAPFAGLFEHPGNWRSVG